MKRSSLLLTVLIALSMAPMLAFAQEPDPGSDVELDEDAKTERIAKGKALKQWTQAHMKLGQHYLQSGDYARAAAHFDTIANVEIDEAAFAKKNKKKNKARKNKKKGKKHGKRGKRVMKVKMGAYLHSAIAHALDGNLDVAMQRADAGIAFAQSKGAERAAQKLERFKADPGKFIERFQPADVPELEAQIREAEPLLPLAP